MKDGDKLPRELVWDGAHVSELGLTALADGQESIVTRDAIEHAGACEWCAGRLGRAALFSAAVGEAVVLVRPAALAPRVVPAPWRALALGVMVAVLAAIPSLPHLVSAFVGALSYGREFSAHGLPGLAKGGAALASNGVLSMATIAAAALLVMMGCALARTRSQESAERSTS
jgi:hypothetical protein